MGNGKKKSREDIEWENRTLCSDESCIGVIGPNGRCKECGKPFKGKPPEGGFRGQEENATETGFDPDEEDEDGPVSEETDSEHDAQEEEDVEDEEHVEDIDWENRTLCSDESCIGVIGPDGRCKECGKRFKA